MIAPALNERQRQAARAGDGPLLVLAGAGTGKTSVIIARITHLLARGVAPDRIVGVTFTNKAAREMAERLRASTPRTRERPLLCTFHSLGHRLLREEHERCGLRARFPIYDEGDVNGVLVEVLRELAGMRAADEGRERVRRAISSFKSRFLSADEALDAADDDASFLCARAYGRYEERMRGLGAVDFDDLIYLPVRFLEAATAATAAGGWRARFDHVLVDEYQDSNTAQYRFARLLAGERENLTVVGDDDQSIYAFRGAEVEKILAFRKDFPRAKVVTLEENYRSTGTILDAANAVIRNNPRRHPKTLRAARGRGEVIPFYTLEDEIAEAGEVVRLVAKAREGGVRLAEQAVLMRSALLARPFEEKLRFHRIPYRVVGGTSYFERREIRDLLAYLRLLVDRADDIALLRILNTPRRGWGKESRERLDSFARGGATAVCAALERLDEIGGISTAARSGAAELVGAIARGAAKLAAGEALSSVVATYLEEVRFAAALEEAAADANDLEMRRRGVGSLLDSLRRAEREGGAGVKVLAEFLDAVTLDPREESDDGAARDELALMTFHSAKGLEFRKVFVVGVEEHLIPHRRAVGEGGDVAVEEERRLFYVALTRARDSLVLTRAEVRRRYGREEETEESRFVAEIPAELIDREDVESAATAPVGEQGAADQIARMRAFVSGGAPAAQPAAPAKSGPAPSGPGLAGGAVT